MEDRVSPKIYDSLTPRFFPSSEVEEKKVYLAAAAAAVNADFVLLRSCSCWKNGGCHKKAAGRIKFLFELYVFYL